MPVWCTVSGTSYLMPTASQEVSTIIPVSSGKQTETQGVNSLMVQQEVAKPRFKLRSLSPNSMIFPWISYLKKNFFSFTKEAGTKILRYPEMKHAGRTQRSVPVLVVNQSEPNNPQLSQHLQKWSLDQQLEELQGEGSVQITSLRDVKLFFREVLTKIDLELQGVLWTGLDLSGVLRTDSV